MLKIGVVCSRREEYDAWLKGFVDWDDLYQFTCITRLDDVMGLRLSSVVRLQGNYYIRDNHEIYVAAKSRVVHYE